MWNRGNEQDEYEKGLVIYGVRLDLFCLTHDARGSSTARYVDTYSLTRQHSCVQLTFLHDLTYDPGDGCVRSTLCRFCQIDCQKME